jgi:DNA polymerase III gamma/tau subunit
MGYDLRAVCRELSRVVHDLLVLTVDPSRIADPEIAGEGERDRLKALAARFSREDLLRAFDLLTRAEAEIRGAAQPRYHLEMALLRWIHLRKLTPLEDLLSGAGSVKAVPGPVKPAVAGKPAVVASGSSRTDGSVKDALLAEVRKAQAVFYNTVLAQAQKVETEGDRITFVFSPTQRTMKDMFEQKRTWLETLAQQVSGRKMTVAAVQKADAQRDSDAASAGLPPAATKPEAQDKKSALREQALADASVQALLEVFPAEIRDVEEM